MNGGSSASDGGGGGASEDPFRMDHPSNTTNSQHELPFLITHWLANYETVQGTREHDGGLLVEDQQRRKDAFEKINRATLEIASAFSELGAYGTTSRPLFRQRRQRQEVPPSNTTKAATFSDVARKWQGLSPNHLETIIQTTASNTVALRAAAGRGAESSSLLDKAREEIKRPEEKGTTGRRLRDTNQEGNNDDHNHNPNSMAPTIPSVLQLQSLLSTIPVPITTTTIAMSPDSGEPASTTNAPTIKDSYSVIPHQHLTVPVESDHRRVQEQSARSVRKSLHLREKCANEKQEIEALNNSLCKQEIAKDALIQEREQFLNQTQPVRENTTAATSMLAGDHPNTAGNGNAVVAVPGAATLSVSTRTVAAELAYQTLQKMDAFSNSEENCNRVIAQLKRKLVGLNDSFQKHSKDSSSAMVQAKQSVRAAIHLANTFHDPFQPNGASTAASGLPISIFPLSSLVENHNHKQQTNSNANPTTNNRLLLNITTRQYGGGGNWRQSRRLFGRTPSPMAAALTQKAVLSKRLSHATTVNAHLSYPVYCQRFDRTGRYFVTGADDYLVKLFYLGPANSCESKRDHSLLRPNHPPSVVSRQQQQKCNYGANGRGAVLVSTLRGHAGVICDIDVSADNALLATASEDGDCRIWGLRDGCPVAILRGHTGGANMVSWSSMTPYRLVTIGSDGLSRIWDIREAAMKRYGTQVRKRLDYLLPLTEAEKKSSLEQTNVELAIASEVTVLNNELSVDITTQAPVLPPLPERERNNGHNNSVSNPAAIGGGEYEHPAIDQGENVNMRAAVVVRPLPPGVPAVDGAAGVGGDGGGGNDNNIDRPEGSFVANGNMDEGVRLIAKLQHGDILQANEQGPSTRARRKAIKVICIARCPLGGHFATGSEDGLGRIWADDEEDRVERIDRRFLDSEGVGVGCRWGSTRGESPVRQGTRKSTRVNSRSYYDSADVPSTSRLLATLAGHVNGVTDLHYSNAGDRILTGSQKDGVVRIWSWGSETASSEHAALSNVSATDTGGNKFSDLKQILIRLTDPSAKGTASASGTQPSRRRGGSAAGSRSSNPNCDVAVWTSDDSKIVTSQCVLVQESGPQIVPGSQFLLVWNSRSGQCLLGISEAHSMSCPVVLPHPSNASILCSAGGDGRVNVWDLDSGMRLLTHDNKVNHGPVEPASDRGKKSAAYLDGSFSPDGLRLALTDDCGRITIFDSLLSSGEQENGEIGGMASNESACDERTIVPFWMKEQYFANDYYDLRWDENGYCVERGSQQPPHMAPRAVRCNHSGVPCPENINDEFRDIVGPLPLPELDCRWQRASIRANGTKVRRTGGLLMQNVQDKRVVIVGEFDPNKAVVIRGTGGEIHGPLPSHHEAIGSRSDSSRRPEPNVINANRVVTGEQSDRESSRYRYLDYNDLLRREEQGIDDGAETDDEDFVDVPRRQDENSTDDSSNDDLEDEEFLQNARRNTSRRRSGGTSRSRRVVRRRRDRTQEEIYEERLQNQPTRISARQLERDAATDDYIELESEGEEYEEVLSTNNRPSGLHVKDYTVVGHFFRMPDSSSSIVKRKWLRRIESKTSYSGMKNYTPQVGDSVVYIPRAHYETINKFPTLDAPWKKWPRNAAWPVVRCCIKDLRYRFPYETYYRNRNNQGERCLSVVTILTLEVTGIPEISADDRWFPWPKPHFIARQSRSANLTFEVSMFESDLPDYVIPEELYLWRLETLEAAIIPRAFNPRLINILTYFVPTDVDAEDANFETYPAHLWDKTNNDGRSSDIHLNGSGFESLEIKWDIGRDDGIDISPWEVLVRDFVDEVPPSPCMNESVKKAVALALEKIENQSGVEKWFSKPVDFKRYSDYLNRIEVPMDFAFIWERIREDYYSNKLSVVSDVKLIRENCIKYNGENADMSQTADELYAEFQGDIDEIDEPVPSPRRPSQRVSAAISYGEEVPPAAEQRRSPRSARARRSYVENEGPSTVERRLSQGSMRARNARVTQHSERRLSSDFESASALERLPPPNAVSERLSSSRVENENVAERGHRTRSARGMSDRTETSVLGRAPRMANRRRASDEHASSSEEDWDEKSVSENDEESSDDEPQRSRAQIGSDGSDSSVYYSSEEVGAPSRRSSRQRTSLRQHSLSESDENVEVPTRKSSRRLAPQNSYTSDDDDDNDSTVEEIKESTRRESLRVAPARRRPSLDEEEDTTSLPPRRPSKRSPPSLQQSPRRSSSRGSRAHPSYQEIDHSDMDSEEGIGESEDEDNVNSSESEIAPKRNTLSGSVKRKAPATTSTKNQAQKKSRAKNPKIVRALPDLTRWPDIPLGDISTVIKAVMKRMEIMDADRVFAEPVVVTYPEIMVEYLAAIARPMDFRTINEERFNVYKSIAEFQQDLIEVYQNCTIFNKEGSDLWNYAVSQWEILNDVFRNICEEEKILLPRRFV